MTTPIANNALHTGTVGTDAKNARLAMGGLVAVQGPGAMDVRTGVMVGPGSTTLLTGTPSTAPMKVAIGAHPWVTSRGSANGPYLGVLAAAGEVDIDPAPGSGTRIDVVWEKQEDSTAGVPSKDLTTGPIYGVTKGLVGQPKQPIPVGAEELGTVAVTAGATATNDSNILITNTARQTVARGAPIPVRTKAERSALSKYVGLAVARLDLGGRVERYTGTGDIWADSTDVPVLASIAARDAYFTGNLRAGASALVADNVHVYSGTKWCFTLSGQMTGTTDANGIIPVAHGAGQAPTSVQITPRDAGDTVNQRVKWLEQSSDATLIQARAVRTDTSAYWAGAAMAFNWTAKF